MLHMNGFVLELNGLQDFSYGARLVYRILEAIAYPAIHLYVLAGSYLIIKRGAMCINAKAIVSIYL